MTIRLQAWIVLATLMAARPAVAQETVVAAGRDLEIRGDLVARGPLHAQLGRELRPGKHLGVRASLEYTRSDTRRVGRPFIHTDSGFVLGNPIVATSRSRILGAWVIGTYIPVRWVVEPYLIAGLGIQDSYWQHTASAPDSSFQFDAAASGLVGRASNRNWLGPAATFGFGVSARLGQVNVFGELRRRTELTFGRVYPEGDLPIVVGIRF